MMLFFLGSATQTSPSPQMLPTTHSPSDLHAWPTSAARAVAAANNAAATANTKRAREAIRSGRQLPLAVLQDQAHVGGLDLFAFAALDLERGVVAGDLARLDLELRTLNLLAHLVLHLVAGLIELRRHHALIH